jgi:hypothetical protein
MKAFTSIAISIVTLTLIISQVYFIAILNTLPHPIYSGPLTFSVTVFIVSFIAGIGYFFSRTERPRKLLWILVGSILLGGCIVIRWCHPYNHTVQFLIIGISDITLVIYCRYLLNSRVAATATAWRA